MIRRRICVWLALIVMTAVLSACGGTAGKEQSFIVRVDCQSKDIYQIYYTYYINGERRGMGGMADLEGGAITEDSDLAITFSSTSFDLDDDIGTFSIDFSPYGKNDTAEITTTAPVQISAAYGETYTVTFSGSRGNGFQAILEE